MADNQDVGSGPLEEPKAMGWQPYDACSDADVGGWAKISANVPYGSESLWRTEFEDSGPWRQT